MKFNQSVLALAAVLTALPAAAQTKDPIRIGVVTPLTGTYAPLGTQIKWAIDLAAKEINESGGILGRKVELLYEDEEANPAVATQRAEKLFLQSKVDFLTGTVNSGSTLAVGQVAERAGKIMATSVSFSDVITGEKCSPNVFRVNAKAGMQSSALAAWLLKEKPGARIYYLGPDYEMGRNTVASFKSTAEKGGAKTLGEVFAPLDSKDYSTFFGQIRAAKPDVFYTSVGGNDSVRLFTQMEEYGLKKNMVMIGAASVITPQTIGAMGNKVAEGFVTGVGYSPELDTPENKAFVTKFRTAYKADPDVYAADSYGVMYFYKHAAEKAKSTETDKIRAAMRGLEWSTPQGKKQMRAGDHQGIQDMYAVKVMNGQFKIIGKVPGSVAVGPDTCTRF